MTKRRAGLGVVLMAALASCTTDEWTYHPYPADVVQQDAPDAARDVAEDGDVPDADASQNVDASPDVDVTGPDGDTDVPDADAGMEAGADVREDADAGMEAGADAGDAAPLRLSGSIASAGSSASGTLRVTGTFESTGRVCAGALCVTGSVGP